jgi:drug/metabolite transporter (DMT)-like permease
MNTLKLNRIPSCLAVVAAVAVISLPIMGGPVGWRERLYDPAVFLTALTLAGVAMVLWPLGDDNAAPLQAKVRNVRP